MLVLPLTNHFDHSIPFEVSNVLVYGTSQTIPISSSTDSQNHSKLSFAFLDSSSNDEMLCFCMNRKILDSWICFSVGTNSKSDKL